MSNDPREEKSQHYRAPLRGFGAVRDEEDIALALFNSKPRLGQELGVSDFSDGQLRNADQSVIRLFWTSRRAFERYFATTRNGNRRDVAGIAYLTAGRVRDVPFEVADAKPLIAGKAFCVLDRVEAGDHDGHASIGYSAPFNKLTDKQKKKYRDLAKKELARRFSRIDDVATMRWQSSLSAAYFSLLYFVIKSARNPKVLASRIAGRISNFFAGSGRETH